MSTLGYSKYATLSAGQAKIATGEEYSPGFTAGVLASHVLAAVMLQDRPWSRIECDAARLDDDEEFSAPIPTEETITYMQYYAHGLNRFM